MNTNLQGCGGSLESRWGHSTNSGVIARNLALASYSGGSSCATVPRMLTATTIAKDGNARRTGLTRFALRDTQIPLSETCGT
jgi:hypothetical protein